MRVGDQIIVLTSIYITFMIRKILPVTYEITMNKLYMQNILELLAFI